MTPSRAAIVIPARYGSSRFPGKPLARQTGKFLIQHVVEQASKARRAQAVLVATDDSRIFDAVKSFGGQAVMTSNSHQSGTDRIAEVIRRPEFSEFNIIVNVQGDEPDIDPNLIDILIGVISRGDDTEAAGSHEPLAGVPMATVAAPFSNSRDIENPNHVKVVVDQRHFALYFSRAAIPFDRDHSVALAGPPQPDSAAPATLLYRKHLGIYAYRRDALLMLSAAPVCELERLERLEQLRALYLGLRIFVQDTANAPHGVDTPEDYFAFVKRYNDANAPMAQPMTSV